MAAHLHWRIYISANNGNANNTSTGEIEFRASAGGADQANGGTATAASFASGFEPAKAFDDAAGNLWITATGQAVPTWIAYQFPSAVAVAEVSIKCESTTTNRWPKDFVVQHSDNGTDWVYQAAFTSVTGWAAGVAKTFTVAAASQPIAGEASASLTGVAALSLGTPLSGAAPGAVTGTADLATGTHLSATGRIEVTPRGRLAGAAPSANTGNFFLLF